MVFGRAADMSWETGEPELFEAARGLRENPSTGQALVTLHVSDIIQALVRTQESSP